MSKFTWLKKFLEHGQIFVSVASVAVALMAFGLTIYNAKLDREYKELSIKPYLHLDVETSDFHVGFINTGLGPAEIEAVALKFKQPNCLYLYRREKRPTDEPTQAAENIYQKVLLQIDEYFGDPLAQLGEQASVWDPIKYPRLYTRTLTPGEIIPANQEVIIFQLQGDQLEMAEKKLKTLSSDAYNKLMQRFFARASAIPYYVNFCSLTGAYCVKQIEANCS